MNEIKICHVVSGLKSGGVESMIYNYCKLIKEENIKWHILYQHEPDKKKLKEFEKIGFKLKRIPSKRKHPIKNFLESYKYFKKYDIDIVHAHMNIMNFIPLIAAKMAKVKCRISHSHSCCLNETYLKKIFFKFLKKVIINYSTMLIACGERAGKYLYGKNKFIILNNAIDLKKFSYNDRKRKELRKKLKISESDFVIGHVGRFSYPKNQEFLVKLFYLLKENNRNIKLILIGEGDDFLKIKSIVKAQDYNQNIFFPGTVDNVNDYYSCFDIFLLPSFWEGLPVAGIEAQVSGLYCIFSDGIDRSVILSKQQCEFCELELEKWIKKLEELMKNKKEIDRKKVTISNEYDIYSQSKKLYRLYLENWSEKR